MVSTRSVRYKFGEGERVLCYEPDPTKAKVLYDSKVLEVIESKDKRGRRSVEYLIHFQGWNSSWDRCVSEDFVLKDTEENRQLQRDLAEKSQLQLGAYLYRRERKKGNSTNSGSGGPSKRPRHGFSDDGSSSSTQPDADGDEVETEDTDSSSGSGSSNQPNSPPNSQTGRASIVLPSALRDRLTFDYHLVVKRGRLSRLPAVPCVAQILESYVKWFARSGAWNPPRARHDPPHKPDMLDVSCRLNLLREVADGLRVYFDFILRGHLLYKQEHEQYFDVCGKYIDVPKIKKEIKEEPKDETEYEEATVDPSVLNDVKSPNLPEYAHLPPIPPDLPVRDENGEENHNNNRMEGDTEGEAEGEVDGDGEMEPEPEPEPDPDPEPEQETEPEAEPEAIPEEEEVDNKENIAILPQMRPRRDPDIRPSRHRILARRLRSHKSGVSQSENEEPGPSTSTAEQRTFETLSSSVGSSESSMSSGWARGSRAPPPAQPPPPAHPPRNPLSQLLDKVAKWQLIPREGTEHLPCRIYGAIHLARLFVKLPDFLNATQMPDLKLKLVLKHIDMFVQYLDEHDEWFGEMYYVSDGASRSH